MRGGRGSGNGANCSDGWDKMEEDKLNSFVHLGKRPDTRAFLVLVCRYLVLFAIVFLLGNILSLFGFYKDFWVQFMWSFRPYYVFLVLLWILSKGFLVLLWNH